MAQNPLAGLQHIKTHVKNNSLIQSLHNSLSQIGARFTSAVLPEAASSTGFFELRKSLAKRLHKQKKKYRLALESLGWGTLVDLLESALCGQELNVRI